MSHDKIKAAARERMAATGEPYAAARHEVIREHQAVTGRGPLPRTTVLLWINGPCGVGKTATAAEPAGLAIKPVTDGPVRTLMHRYATTARAIHWG